jgi:uncharacterized membrane protein SirB2
MSDFDNPYQSPETQIVPESQNTSDGLTQITMGYLRETAPWLRFLGILGYIQCGMILVSGLILAATMLIADFSNEISGISVWLLVLIYIPLAILFFFPSRFIYNFGNKLRLFLSTNSMMDLELSLKYNKSLWKYLGILSIIMLASIPISIVIAIVGGVVAALSGTLS